MYSSRRPRPSSFSAAEAQHGNPHLCGANERAEVDGAARGLKTRGVSTEVRPIDLQLKAVEKRLHLRAAVLRERSPNAAIRSPRIPTSARNHGAPEPSTTRPFPSARSKSVFEAAANANGQTRHAKKESR